MNAVIWFFSQTMMSASGWRDAMKYIIDQKQLLYPESNTILHNTVGFILTNLARVVTFRLRSWNRRGLVTVFISCPHQDV